MLNSMLAIQGSRDQHEDSTKELSLEDGQRWFVARVHSGRESSAQLNLARLNFRSFAPRISKTVRHARKVRTVLAPLFPGYIFIILDLSKDRWRVVNSAFGVASLIMGPERPTPVPPGIVEALVSARKSSVLQFGDDLMIGQRVRILSGPFADALCRLVHLDDRGRVRVLLEFMGTEVTAQVDRSRIAPAA